MGDPWCSGYLNFASNIHYKHWPFKISRTQTKGPWASDPVISPPEAFFYSVVSRDTQELYHANRRQQFLVEQGYNYQAWLLGRRKHELFFEWMSWRKNGIYWIFFAMYIRYCTATYMFWNVCWIEYTFWTANIQQKQFLIADMMLTLSKRLKSVKPIASVKPPPGGSRSPVFSHRSTVSCLFCFTDFRGTWEKLMQHAMGEKKILEWCDLRNLIYFSKESQLQLLKQVKLSWGILWVGWMGLLM